VKSHVSKKRKERNEVDRPSRQAGGRDGISQCQTYPASEHKAALEAKNGRDLAHARLANYAHSPE